LVVPRSIPKTFDAVAIVLLLSVICLRQIRLGGKFVFKICFRLSRQRAEEKLLVISY
jgi:hypothetical protein